MAMYKITFTPSGPYFFGNENTFAYKDDKKDNPYFISGEAMPSQSTLFGALRYLLMPKKGFQNLNVPENVKAIGEIGFNMDKEDRQLFGCIKKMSAAFVTKDEELFIPTPLDHNCNKPKKETVSQGDNGEEKSVFYYTPFTDYRPFTTLEGGNKIYPNDYSAKEGLACSFMSLRDRHLESELIGSSVRVGINRKDQQEGFFKKEYKFLKPGYSFCVFAEIERGSEQLTEAEHVVSLGQGKVPFFAKFEACEGDPFEKLEGDVKKALTDSALGRKRWYCLGDAVVGDGLYEKMAFAIVATREHRSFSRAGNYKKSKNLHKLVKAGSVFFAEEGCERDHVFLSTGRQKNANTLGYNSVVVID